MKFRDILKEEKSDKIIEILDKKDIIEISLAEAMDAEKILRTKFKIKSVHGTKFGTEFIMAKKYDEDEIKNLLTDYQVKFDGKSVFVIG